MIAIHKDVGQWGFESCLMRKSFVDTTTFTRLGNLANQLDVGTTVSTSTPLMVSGTDFVTLPTKVTFAPGNPTATFTFTANPDSLDEDNEMATVSMVANAAFNIGTPNPASVTIIDDDPLPSVTFQLDGVTTQTIRVILSAVSGREVKVNVSLANGTATSSLDCNPHVKSDGHGGLIDTTAHGYLYQQPRTLTIPVNQLSKDIDVAVCPGSKGKNFFVNLASPVNAGFSDSDIAAQVQVHDSITGARTWSTVICRRLPSPCQGGQEKRRGVLRQVGCWRAWWRVPQRGRTCVASSGKQFGRGDFGAGSERWQANAFARQRVRSLGA